VGHIIKERQSFHPLPHSDALIRSLRIWRYRDIPYQFTGTVPTLRSSLAARALGDDRPQQGRWTQIILPVSICDSNELVRANN
jgi:hypothetical protein